MARLEAESLDLSVRTGNWREDFQAEVHALEALQAKADEAARRGELRGTIFQSQIADGYAYYIVTKERPFTLQHISFGDSWQVPWYVIDGLTAKNMRALNEQTLRWHDAFRKEA